MKRFAAFLEGLLMPTSIKKASAIICVSETTLADLVALDSSAADKTKVIPLASRYPLSDTPCSSTSDKPYILHVGTHEPRKNLPRLIRSFKQAKESSLTNFQLVLAGNPGWKEDIPTLLQQLCLADQVRIVTSPSDAELANLYRGCEFFAFPSIYEGFGLPIVEALAFGKPVLTSNCSSMPEAAGKAGIYIDPHSEQDITEALIELMTNKELRDQLSSYAFKQAAKFDWDKNAEETIRLIKLVADRT